MLSSALSGRRGQWIAGGRWAAWRAGDSAGVRASALLAQLYAVRGCAALHRGRGRFFSRCVRATTRGCARDAIVSDIPASPSTLRKGPDARLPYVMAALG